MDFDLRVEYQDDIPVVAVSGDVDIYTAPVLDDYLQRLIRAGHTEVCVDLTSVPYLDSEGLKALVRAYKLVGEGGRITINGATGSVLRIFRVSGLDKIFGLRTVSGDVDLP